MAFLHVSKGHVGNMVQQNSQFWTEGRAVVSFLASMGQPGSVMQWHMEGYNLTWDLPFHHSTSCPPYICEQLSSAISFIMLHCVGVS